MCDSWEDKKKYFWGLGIIILFHLSSIMYQYRPTSTDDGLDSLDIVSNPNLSHNAEAPIEAGILINDAITTGINWSLIHLLIHGLISLLWGIALAIFSSGIVPVTWAVSQYGKTHLVVTNVLITLVATATTTHIKYISQGVLQLYSQYVLVNGFTVKQLAWMQGIKEWSLFTTFGSRKKRAAWLVIYAGMAVHSASVVSILQPSMSNNLFNLVPFLCNELRRHLLYERLFQRPNPMRDESKQRFSSCGS